MRFIVLLLVLLLFPATLWASPSPAFVLLPDTPYATDVYLLHGGQSGPAVLILGGIHGNEPAGAAAAARLTDISLTKGTLVIVPQVNKLALAQDIRTLPEIGDINRAYPGKATGFPAERLAAGIMDLVAKYNVSVFIDLHEGRTFHRLDKTSVGQMILFAPNTKSTDLALGALEAVNQGLEPKYKKFALGAHPIPYSGAWYAGEKLGLTAFTVETSGEQSLEDRVGQHLTIVKYILGAEGLIAP